MKLSTKGRYGLKAMVDLATEYDSDGKLSIAQLSERQGISYSYLEQLIALLKKAHLVSASRGAAGGYRLSRPPEQITVGEVLKALEGSTALVAWIPAERTATTFAPARRVRCGSSCSSA